MILRPPRSTRTDTLFPYTTLFRSGELQMPPVLQRQTAAALAAVGGGGADEVLQHFRPLRPCERLGGDGDKLVDRRMLLKLLVANPPHVGEPAVPQIGRAACRERVCQYG